MTDSLANAKAASRPNGEDKSGGKGKGKGGLGTGGGRPRTPCELCGKLITAQGMKAHRRYKHPNAGDREAEMPRSIDIGSYRQGLLDGVLGALGIRGVGRAA